VAVSADYGPSLMHGGWVYRRLNLLKSGCLNPDASFRSLRRSADAETRAAGAFQERSAKAGRPKGHAPKTATTRSVMVH